MPTLRRMYLMILPLVLLGACGKVDRTVQVIATGGPYAAAGVKITAAMKGKGAEGRFTFPLPGEGTCEGPWNVVKGGGLSNITGIGAYTSASVASDTGTAVGICTNGATFQFDFTLDAKTGRGEGTGKDSNGNFYRVTL